LRGRFFYLGTFLISVTAVHSKSRYEVACLIVRDLLLGQSTEVYSRGVSRKHRLC